MYDILLISLSLVVLLVVAALVREIRLRRALETLLRRLLAFWRSHERKKPEVPLDGDVDGAGPPGDGLQSEQR